MLRAIIESSLYACLLSCAPALATVYAIDCLTGTKTIEPNPVPIEADELALTRGRLFRREPSRLAVLQRVFRAPVPRCSVLFYVFIVDTTRYKVPGIC